MARVLAHHDSTTLKGSLRAILPVSLRGLANLCQCSGVMSGAGYQRTTVLTRAEQLVCPVGLPQHRPPADSGAAPWHHHRHAHPPAVHHPGAATASHACCACCHVTCPGQDGHGTLRSRRCSTLPYLRLECTALRSLTDASS